jgi:hypothetical protein
MQNHSIRLRRHKHGWRASRGINEKSPTPILKAVLADPLELSCRGQFRSFFWPHGFPRECVIFRTYYQDQNQVACYAIPYLLFVYALSFPLTSFSRTSIRPATQSFAPWFREQLRDLALTLAGGTLLAVVLYAVFRRARHVVDLGNCRNDYFLGILLLIAPVYIEPLFNTYKP